MSILNQQKGNAKEEAGHKPEFSPEDDTPKTWLEMAASPGQIWKSRISWRITTAVFATILLVQTIVLIFTARGYEQEQLDHLRSVAHAAIVSAIDNQQQAAAAPSAAAALPAAATVPATALAAVPAVVQEQAKSSAAQLLSEHMTSPISRTMADKLMKTTIIEGMAIYGLDYSVIQITGLPALLQPKLTGDMKPYYRTVDNKHYEVLFLPSEIGKPYNIVAKLDASDVEPKVVTYVHQTLWILLLMSGFVTAVLMLVMSQWLLEPMIVLRNNLLSAAKNPEKPNIQRLKKETRDEIGIAIRIANDLIRQNANNLKKLRSTAEDKIHKLAYFDTLTGLPNRTYFLETLDGAIKHKVMEEDGRIAVLSVDIDHFKDINDTMGHEIGDKLLEAIGKRLVKVLPDDAIVSRASADEFTIMVHLKNDNPDSSIFVERIFASMVEPISILQERFQVRVSIGVAHCPDDGIEGRQIMKNADIALNRAKEEGRDTVRYYSQDFDRAIQQRFQILRDLRTAMDEKQLSVYYHPQFNLKTGQLIGAEALLRWWRPDDSKEGGKFISPAEFVPVAEQSGLIVPIGEFVMRSACQLNKKWLDQGLPPMRIAVNISGVQFHRSDIVSLVSTVLKETGLPPAMLELEVTESVFMENMQVAIDILNKLHALGVELAVDDFGTGYSSLSYLRQFPIDRLKVDQSFTRNALTNEGDRLITKTIINLGHSLGLKVIAEGVETDAHENFLKEAGCDESQGYKYTKPIPADKFWEFALAHNRANGQSKLTAV